MTTTYNDSVGAAIRSQIAWHGLSQASMAIQLGWSQAYMSRRISGKVPWRTDDLEQIAALLKISLTELSNPRIPRAAS